MNHIIGFSGGIASSVLAGLVLRENPSAVLLFHDTKTEPADNARFRADVSKFLGVPITEDSDGRNIWQLFDDQGFLGSGRNTPCSHVLKQARSLNYLKNHLPATLYIGFTADEYDRAQRVFARYHQHGIETRFPLIENRLSKEECFHRVSNCWKLDPPHMYAWAEHANCVPCVKGKKAYWGLIYMKERAAWEKASEYEEKFGHTIFTEAGSLKGELPNCLRLAEQYLKKRDGGQRQASLFALPCECGL
jgi:3'-phosphoadenosine 5'-phosphosulfate sulfotransferase (PAPS reductase)/FAD synthetase